MKANQTEGKRHSWKEKGKKILSPALLCLCAVMLLVWAVQLLFFEDAYRFIKSWKLEDVMEQVCEHLDKEHLPQIVEELRLDNIDIRVIDAQQGVEAAQRIQLDTSYFLMGPEGGEEDAQ